MRYNSRQPQQKFTSSKRIIVKDVPDLSKPAGTADENDVMRKLVLQLNDIVDDFDGRISALEPPAAPTPTTDKDTTKGGGPNPTQWNLLTSHNSSPVVPITRNLNFVDQNRPGGVFFEVTRPSTHEAKIRAYVKLPDSPFNTVWGVSNGGYIAEIDSTSAPKPVDMYGGANGTAQPTIVQKARTLIHFIGDGYVDEPQRYHSISSPTDNTRKGFGKDLPSLEAAVWTSKVQGAVIHGEAYDSTVVKVRVSPNLTFFDPDESTHTSNYVTRVFMKETASVKPTVAIDAAVTDSAFPGGTDPREFTAAISFEVKDELYTGINLGTGGTDIAEVFSGIPLPGKEFQFRRLKAGANVSITEDANYITITATTTGGGGGSYLCDNIGTGTGEAYAGSTGSSPTTFHFKRFRAGSGISIVNGSDYIQISSTIVDTNTTYTLSALTASGGAKVRLTGSDATTNDVTFLGAGGTTVTYSATNTITISSTDTNTTYDTDVIDSSGVYLRLNGSDSSHSNTKFTGSGGIVIARTNAHEINIGNTVVDTNTTYTHYATSATGGANVRLHGSDSTNVDILFDGAGGTTVTYIDPAHIQISSYVYALDNCAAGTGTGFVYHDSSVAGNTTTYHLRTIKAGTGIGVSTVGHDIVVSSTVVDTNDLYYAANVGTGAGKVWRDTTDSGSTHTFNLKSIKAGTGISVTNNPDDITIACTITDTNTLYDHSAEASAGGAILRLHGSDGSVDDILLESTDNSISIVRVDGSTIDFKNNLHIPFDVVADNVNDCSISSAPYGWFKNYTDSAGVRTLHFRTFQVSNDLKLNTCVSDYLLDVNITGDNLTDNFELYYGKDSASSRLQFRGLQAGPGISLSYVDDDPVAGDHDIRIECTVTDSVAVIDNCAAGTGAGLIFHDTTVSGLTTTYHLRTIKAGSNVTVSTSGHDILISSSYTDTNDTYSFANVGTGTGTIWRNTVDAGSAHTVNLKTLKAGTNISITNGADDITITSTDTNTTYSHSAVATSGGAFIRLTGSDSSTSDVALISSDGSVTITRTSASVIDFHVSTSWLTSATGQNLGGDQGVWSSTTTSGGVSTLKFRGITAGTDIYLTGDSTQITVNAWQYLFTNIDDCTSGATPYSFFIGVDTDSGAHTKTAKFRKFQVFNDLTCTPCGNDYLLDVNVGGANLGTYAVYYDKYNHNLRFRGLVAGTNISLSYVDDDPANYHDIQIDCTAVNDTYTFDNLGGGDELYASVTDTGHAHVVHFNTISATGDIYHTFSSNKHTYNLSINGHSNSTGGEHVYVNRGVTSGNVLLNFRGIKAADSSITVTADTRDVLIKSNYKVNVVIDGIMTTGATEIDFVNAPYDITFTNLSSGTTAAALPLYEGYTTRFDSPCFWDPLASTNVSQILVADRAWEKVLFTNVVIDDFAGYVDLSAGEFKFEPYAISGTTVDFHWNWIVNVFIAFTARNPTDSGRTASLAFPELAIFVDGMFYSTLDVDRNMHISGQLRSYLALHGVGGFTDSDADSASRIALHGTDVVHIPYQTASSHPHKIEIKVRHATGSDRILSLDYGYVSFSKVGTKGTQGGNIPQPSYDFTGI